MTTTHPDLTALLAAVRQFPADDTPRLVLADCLDEHGQHERAEFIRVQCELARTPILESDYPACTRCGGDGFAVGPPESRPCRACDATGKQNHKAYKHARRLLARERELLTDARRAQWSGIKCPNCGDVRAKIGGFVGACALCDSTGFAPVEFRRGFVESVTCRMGDVLREQYEGHAAGLPVDPDDQLNSREWALTPWARGVLAAHPVTRWEIVDREPLDNAGVGTYFGEEPGPATKWTWVRGNGPIEWEIPAPVYQFCTDHYDSPELARDALALAVGRVARRLAGLTEVMP